MEADAKQENERRNQALGSKGKKLPQRLEFYQEIVKDQKRIGYWSQQIFPQQQQISLPTP